MKVGMCKNWSVQDRAPTLSALWADLRVSFTWTFYYSLEMGMILSAPRNSGRALARLSHHRERER